VYSTVVAKLQIFPLSKSIWSAMCKTQLANYHWFWKNGIIS